MDEGLGDLVGVGRRDLDVVAQHVVVAHLEPGDAGLLAVACLEPGDQPAALVAQGHQLVEVGGVARRDEAAVAGDQRQLGPERPVQAVDQGVVAPQPRVHGGDRLGRRAQAGLGQVAAQHRSLAQRVAQGGQVARPATPHGEPRQGALDIGTAPEHRAQGPAQAALGDEELDAIKAAGDGRGVSERRRQAGRQEPRPGAGDAAVDDREQTSSTLTRKRHVELEIPPGRPIDDHHRAPGQGARRGEPRQPALLGQLDVIDQRAAGAEFGPAEAPEGVERRHLEQRLEAALAGGAVEARRRQWRQRRLPTGEGLEQRGPLEQAVGDQQLAGLDARQFGGQGLRHDRLDVELASRNVEPGERQGLAGAANRRQVVVAASIEQGVLGDGAGGDDAYRGALDQRLATAFPGLGRVLDLFADGDLEAGPDEALEVAVAGPHRHAAHGYIRAVVLAALGQRDVERPRRGHGVVEEQLIEVAHAVKQQAIRVFRLDCQVLDHHWRDAVTGGRDAVTGGRDAVAGGRDVVTGGRCGALWRGAVHRRGRLSGCGATLPHRHARFTPGYRAPKSPPGSSGCGRRQRRPRRP